MRALVFAAAAVTVTFANQIEVAPEDVTCQVWHSEGCCKSCEQDCCGEGEPERQCSGCGPEMKCHPQALCYNRSDPARKYAKFKDVTGTDESEKPPGEACQAFCKDTAGIGCCNFSTPCAATDTNPQPMRCHSLLLERGGH